MKAVVNKFLPGPIAMAMACFCLAASCSSAGIGTTASLLSYNRIQTWPYIKLRAKRAIRFFLFPLTALKVAPHPLGGGKTFCWATKDDLSRLRENLLHFDIARQTCVIESNAFL